MSQARPGSFWKLMVGLTSVLGRWTTPGLALMG